MAFFNQEKKSKIAPAIKSLLKEYGLKGSLSVENHSTVVLTIKEGFVDFGDAKGRINEYWISQNFQGVAQEFLLKALDILNTDNFDKSDVMSDYFHVGHYVNISIGKWNKPYVLKEPVAKAA